jgi:hypothetical protein
VEQVLEVGPRAAVMAAAASQFQSSLLILGALLALSAPYLPLRCISLYLAVSRCISPSLPSSYLYQSLIRSHTHTDTPLPSTPNTLLYTLYPYSLHPTPCSLKTRLLTLHPTPDTLHPTPHTLQPCVPDRVQGYGLNPQPWGLRPKPFCP